MIKYFMLIILENSRAKLQEYNSVKIFVYPIPNIQQIIVDSIHIQNFVYGNTETVITF